MFIRLVRIYPCLRYLVFARCAPIFELIQAIGEIYIYGINFASIHIKMLSESRYEKICQSAKNQGHI